MLHRSRADRRSLPPTGSRQNVAILFADLRGGQTVTYVVVARCVASDGKSSLIVVKRVWNLFDASATLGARRRMTQPLFTRKFDEYSAAPLLRPREMRHVAHPCVTFRAGNDGKASLMRHRFGPKRRRNPDDDQKPRLYRRLSEAHPCTEVTHGVHFAPGPCPIRPRLSRPPPGPCRYPSGAKRTSRAAGSAGSLLLERAPLTPRRRSHLTAAAPSHGGLPPPLYVWPARPFPPSAILSSQG